MEVLLGSGQVAQVLGVSVTTVFNWTQAGKLHPIKNASGKKRYLLSEVQSLLPKQKCKLEGPFNEWLWKYGDWRIGDLLPTEVQHTSCCGSKYFESIESAVEWVKRAVELNLDPSEVLDYSREGKEVER